MNTAERFRSAPLIKAVSKAAIMQMWPLYEPAIDAALALSPVDDLNADDMRQKLLADEAVLIEIANDARVFGYATAEIETLRQGDAIHVMTLAGEDMHLWLDDFVDYMKSLARSMDCPAGITLSGREGWRRQLKAYGFKPIWSVLRCSL